MYRFAVGIVAILWLSAAGCRSAEVVRWRSDVTGAELRGEVVAPADVATPTPAVVYLKNLSIPRLGREPDESIIADLRRQGFLVLVLDYANHAAARSPDLNADILKLRRDISDAKTRSLLIDRKIDPDRLFILCEGFRLKQNVEFARDGQRVLAMDVMYPSDPAAPVPALMEITCDNVNRMGSFSLLYCHDTLLEGAQAAGFAVAMADHPVAPPYKGLDDPMPQSLQRMKSAVRTLRGLSDELNLNGRIGVIGFSRGGPFAAMLACTNGRADLDPAGADASSDIQAALIHGNRYDYLNLPPDDPMLPRFENAWGPLAENRERWAAHGAAHYLRDGAAPMYLNTSDAESPEYRNGLARFAALLKARGIDHVYVEDKDGRGHRVTTEPSRLADIYQFFQTRLAASP